jgi:aryl-alcohol dehydrogenase-like predicted oxidoreductase
VDRLDSEKPYGSGNLSKSFAAPGAYNSWHAIKLDPILMLESTARRTLLGTTGLEVFPLCLGGNVFGWTLDEESSFAVLDAYVDAGGNFIDTADVYSRWAAGNVGGESEAIIGAWMKERGNRDEIVLATKVGMACPLDEANIREHLEDSLGRLQTDRVDLYYAHRDDPDTPLEVTMRVLDSLVREGLVGHLAASNYSAPRLEQALALSASEGLAAFAVLQPHYNLMERARYEGALERLCAERAVPCLPYYALASGFLTGKHGPDRAPAGERAADVSKYMTPAGWDVLEALAGMAKAHGASPAAIALTWLAAQETVAAPIASATSPAQLASQLAFLHLDLSQEELAALDVASAAVS